MKNASGFICAILLAVTTSIALPSDKPVKKAVKKPEAAQKNTAAEVTEPAKQKIITPVFHWFGPLEQKKGQRDNC
ncbi:hypothetical protein [Dyadobacter sp. Leaf189]|uniref:hypothetical protein n=1 Tax=Dyadobacter sp. Leaf189 TaxID=1736295 RepID=UPI0006FBEB9B|nr:hypothetical protein [Dyadobacter sp. Leaf189]KQS33552.1 hypothetical protein ASG33_05645 [Dyadobacter sp. Leaf189]